MGIENFNNVEKGGVEGAAMRVVEKFIDIEEEAIRRATEKLTIQNFSDRGI